MKPQDVDGWLAQASRIDCPNYDHRPPGTAIDLLVVHYISLPAGQFGGDLIERLFTNQLRPDDAARLGDDYALLSELRVSSHLLIRRQGELLQFVDCDQRAWHAGVSRFGERQRCNDFSIGIELEGDAHHRFTSAQYRQLDRVVRTLLRRYPLRYIVGHSDIAPGRKDDPGPMFDWPRVLGKIASTGLTRPIEPLHIEPSAH